MSYYKNLSMTYYLYSSIISYFIENWIYILFKTSFSINLFFRLYSNILHKYKTIYFENKVELIICSFISLFIKCWIHFSECFSCILNCILYIHVHETSFPLDSILTNWFFCSTYTCCLHVVLCVVRKAH